MIDKIVSNALLDRLPRYMRYLGELDDQGVERISSKELSELMHLTASQIRQDFNTFGGFGQQGYGYSVKLLMSEFKKILGIDKRQNMVIIGAGNQAKALTGLRSLANIGFEILAVFDIKNRKGDRQINGVPVLIFDEFTDFVKANDVSVAALTIPSSQVQAIANIVIDSGIKGIWNFAHIDLELLQELDIPDDIVVKNVYLIDSLMQLSFRMKNTANTGAGSNDMPDDHTNRSVKE